MSVTEIVVLVWGAAVLWAVVTFSRADALPPPVEAAPRRATPPGRCRCTRCVDLDAHVVSALANVAGADFPAWEKEMAS